MVVHDAVRAERQDLPADWQAAAAKIKRYPTTGTGTLNSGVLSPILQTGWRRAREAVERWIEYHEPTTVQNAATYLHRKVGATALTANVKVSPKTTLPNMQAGTEVLTLPTLRQLVTDGQAIVGNPLLQDWYVRRAQLANQANMTPLARSLDVFAASQSTSLSGYIDTQSATITNAGSADTVRKTGLRLLRGESVADVQFENVLRMCGVNDANNPTGLFLRSVRTTALPAALNEFGRRLAEADRMDVVTLLLRARTEAVTQAAPAKEQPPMAQLGDVMRRKEATVARRASGKPEAPSAVLALLQIAPGLLPSELIAWEPSMAQASTAPVVTATAETVVTTKVAELKKPVATQVAARTVEANPDDALYTQVTDAVYERVPAEYRPFWDNIVRQCNLRGMFDYQAKKRSNRDPVALERLMWTAVSIQMTKTLR